MHWMNKTLVGILLQMCLASFAGAMGLKEFTDVAVDQAANVKLSDIQLQSLKSGGHSFQHWHAFDVRHSFENRGFYSSRGNHPARPHNQLSASYSLSKLLKSHHQDQLYHARKNVLEADKKLAEAEIKSLARGLYFRLLLWELLIDVNQNAYDASLEIQGIIHQQVREGLLPRGELVAAQIHTGDLAARISELKKRRGETREASIHFVGLVPSSLEEEFLQENLGRKIANKMSALTTLFEKPGLREKRHFFLETEKSIHGSLSQWSYLPEIDLGYQWQTAAGSQDLDGFGYLRTSWSLGQVRKSHYERRSHQYQEWAAGVSLADERRKRQAADAAWRSQLRHKSDALAQHHAIVQKGAEMKLFLLEQYRKGLLVITNLIDLAVSCHDTDTEGMRVRSG